MEENTSLPSEQVMSKIFWLRGQKVMLDKDLAILYDVKPIRLREQVKRNSDKFPNHFMFKLTKEETEFMVSQNAIPSMKHMGGSFPYVFTEYGILQLANVLRSSRATEMSIKIIEVFIQMREMLLSNKELLMEVEEIRKHIIGQDEKIEAIFNYLKQLEQSNNEERKSVGYKS